MTDFILCTRIRVKPRKRHIDACRVTCPDTYKCKQYWDWFFKKERNESKDDMGDMPKV